MVEKQLIAYARLLEFLDDFRERPVLPFDELAAVEYRRLTKARLRLGTSDLRTAAITLSRDATLFSGNLSHFRRIPGLKVEDWTKP